MSMITEIISAIPQPSTLTATTPVVPDCLQLVDPCKLDLKEIICLYFSDGNALYVFSVSFQKKHIILGQSKDKKLFLQDSHLHSLLRHQWYQTGGPNKLDFKEIICLFQWRNLELHYTSFLFLFKNIKSSLLRYISPP